MSTSTIKTSFLTPRGTVDVRRVRLVDSGNKYGQLLTFVSSVYIPTYDLDVNDSKLFSLSYVDPDGDECSITSELELIEAIRCAAEENKTVKINVRTRNSATTALVMDAPSRSVSNVSDISIASVTATPTRPSGSISRYAGESSTNNNTSVTQTDADDYVQINSASGETAISPNTAAAQPLAPSAPAAVDELIAGLSLTSTRAPTATAKVAEPTSAVTVEDVTEDEVQQQQALMNDIIQHTTTGVAAPFTTMSASASTTNNSTHTGTAAASAPSVPDVIVHMNIICDGCGMQGIIGDRYKCTVCRDYDLCSNCESSGKHNPNHPLLKIKTPDAASSGRFGGRHGHHGHHGGRHGHWWRQGGLDAATATATATGPGCQPFHGPHGPHGIPHPVDAPWRRRGCGRFNRDEIHNFAERAAEVAADLGFADIAGDDRPKAGFVGDVTLADGIIVKPGQVLQKVWKVKNTGDKAWPEGTRLVFVGGDVAPASNASNDSAFADSVVVPTAAPGEAVNLVMDVITPQELGRVRGTFRLATPSGVRFGPRMWIDVTVTDQEATTTSASASSSSAAASSSSSSSAQESKYADEEKTGGADGASADGLDHNAIRTAIRSVLSSLGGNNGNNALQAIAQAFNQVVGGGVPSGAPTATAAPATAPVADVNGVYPYAHQLELIRSMGFKYDDNVIKTALERNRGHVARTVNMLLNNQQ